MAQKAQKMGVQLSSKQPSPAASRRGSAAPSPSRSQARSPVRRSPEEKIIDDEQVARTSIGSDSSVGNATLRRRPEGVETLESTEGGQRDRRDSFDGTATNEKDQHYNDTMFGGEETAEHMRTASPNDFESIRSNYQHNLTNISDNNEEPIYEEDETQMPTGTHEFQDTGNSDMVVVGAKGSWDPNGTAKMPKQGNEDFVIIEISSFTFKESSEVMARDDVKKLFVGMNFLNYDPADLESKNSMPKPKPNEPVHFHFRKSKNLCDIQRIRCSNSLMLAAFSF